MLWDRRTGRLTVVIRVSPVGVDLADRAQADAWVAAFGGVPRRSGLPADGPPRRDHRRHRAVRRHHPARLRRRSARPGRARGGPGGAGRARRRHPGHQRRRGHPGVRHLRPGPGQPPAHRSGLRGGRGDPLAARARDQPRRDCGVAVLGRATYRMADRAAAGGLRPGQPRRRRPGLDHTPAPPAAAARRTRPDRARRASCWSGRTPARCGPARPGTAAGTTRGCRCPGRWPRRPGRPWPPGCWPRCSPRAPFPRRVTWLYEPYPAEAAAAGVEAEVSAGQIRCAWAPHPPGRDPAGTRRPRPGLQSAREEAEGAGVGRFTFYVTTTVTDPDQLLPPRSPTSNSAPGRPSCGCAACAAPRPPGSPPPSVSGSTPSSRPPAADDPRR